MHFVIVGGGHAGEHIALTPRTMVPLEEDISTNGWASVIVHVIKNPSPSFNESKDIDHIGMAVVELVKS